MVSDPIDFGKVAVLLGGPSAEREISFLSGNAVVGALRSKGVDAYPFDPAERELFELRREGFTRVLRSLKRPAASCTGRVVAGGHPPVWLGASARDNGARHVCESCEKQSTNFRRTR